MFNNYLLINKIFIKFYFFIRIHIFNKSLFLGKTKTKKPFYLKCIFKKVLKTLFIFILYNKFIINGNIRFKFIRKY